VTQNIHHRHLLAMLIVGSRYQRGQFNTKYGWKLPRVSYMSQNSSYCLSEKRSIAHKLNRRFTEPRGKKNVLHVVQQPHHTGSVFENPYDNLLNILIFRCACSNTTCVFSMQAVPQRATNRTESPHWTAARSLSTSQSALLHECFDTRFHDHCAILNVLFRRAWWCVHKHYLSGLLPLIQLCQCTVKLKLTEKRARINVERRG
jgi:hypothetical protein